MVTMDTHMANHQLVAGLDSTDVSVRLAAALTLRLIEDPDAAFDAAVEE